MHVDKISLINSRSYSPIILHILKNIFYFYCKNSLCKVHSTNKETSFEVHCLLAATVFRFYSKTNPYIKITNQTLHRKKDNNKLYRKASNEIKHTYVISVWQICGSRNEFSDCCVCDV